LDSLTERVLGAVFEVTNTLGAGFLEKVYQRALLRELGLRGIRAVAEASFTVTYKGHSAGEYFADLLVEDVLVVELKCVDRFSSEHTAQCLNYLRVSGRTVCLLVNFQKPKVEWKRIVQGFGVSEPLETPRYYVVCPSFVHPFPGHYTSITTLSIDTCFESW
jgi:GxxExxY protein